MAFESLADAIPSPLEVTVRFPLAGDPAGWKKVDLVIQKEGEKEPTKVSASHGAVQRAFHVEPSDIGREVKYVATARNKDAMFNGVNVEPPPTDIGVTVKPVIDTLEVSAEGKKLVATLRTRGWPVNGAFRLTCQQSVAGRPATTMRTRWHYANPINGGSAGGVDSEGTFRATVARTSLVRGATYEVKVIVVSKSGDGRLGGEVYAPQTATCVEGESE
jgi:hypothetical protein